MLFRFATACLFVACSRVLNYNADIRTVEARLRQHDVKLVDMVKPVLPSPSDPKETDKAAEMITVGGGRGEDGGGGASEEGGASSSASAASGGKRGGESGEGGKGGKGGKGQRGVKRQRQNQTKTERNMELMSRPFSLMRGHTSYLTFATAPYGAGEAGAGEAGAGEVAPVGSSASGEAGDTKQDDG
jgi:hypothetical protein